MAVTWVRKIPHWAATSVAPPDSGQTPVESTGYADQILDGVTEDRANTKQTVETDATSVAPPDSGQTPVESTGYADQILDGVTEDRANTKQTVETDATSVAAQCGIFRTHEAGQ